jgi:pectate lyase
MQRREKSCGRSGSRSLMICAVAALVACGSASGERQEANVPSHLLAVRDAFPGAQGHGRGSIGGRGGRITPVTTLADSGPGSLRACIDAQGPRVCVFRVAGVIRFTTERPIIRHPYLTIAGQTAPGGGVLITHAGGSGAYTPLLIKDTHDIIIRHVRVRTDRPGAERQSNSTVVIENSQKVMIDHVSTSWAFDENIGGFNANNDVTISWSIFAEGIPKHDKCALLASGTRSPQRFSFIGNLCAHNGDRNPDINFAPQSCVEVVNNVLYNARFEFAEVWESFGGSPVSIVGNYFRAGPSTAPGSFAITRQTVGSTGRARIYAADNHLDGPLKQYSPSVEGFLESTPPCPLTLSPLPSAQAYAAVLARSGAFPRDDIDRRLVGEVAARAGSIRKEPGTLPPLNGGMPYADSDRDGMADSWERANGASPAQPDAWADADGDGWTNFDEFLQFAHGQLVAGRSVS